MTRRGEAVQYSADSCEYETLRAADGAAESHGGADRLSPLTPRQLEVLQLIAEGSGNQGIARELGISVKTVEKHRQNVMRRLDLHDVAALVRYSISTALVECRHPGGAD